MKKKRLYRSLGLPVGILFLLLSGCVESYDPVLDESDAMDLLVVEGLITDETGPFGIRLTSSAPVYNKDPNVVNEFSPVSGAEVQIYDDQGNFYMLFENEPGWYETEEKELKGTPGYSAAKMSLNIGTTVFWKTSWSLMPRKSEAIRTSLLM